MSKADEVFDVLGYKKRELDNRTQYYKFTKDNFGTMIVSEIVIWNDEDKQYIEITSGVGDKEMEAIKMKMKELWGIK